MSGQLIAGLFADATRGERALEDLKAEGFANAQISELADHEEAPEPQKLTNPFSDFFKDHTTTGSEFQNNLKDLGMSAGDAKHFEDGVARGGSLVTVQADTRSELALSILQKNGADMGSLGEGSASGLTGIAGASGDRTIELREERLAIDKTRVASGSVRIGKKIISEQASIEVPVSHDELVIERHKVADGAIGGKIGGDESIQIPLSRDEVRVSKEAYTTEEVDVGKRTVAGTERVTDTLRREELVVDQDIENKMV